MTTQQASFPSFTATTFTTQTKSCSKDEPMMNLYERKQRESVMRSRSIGSGKIVMYRYKNKMINIIPFLSFNRTGEMFNDLDFDLFYPIPQPMMVKKCK